MTVFAVSITGQQKKVYKEFMMYAIGRNINKYHRFLPDEIKKFAGKVKKRLFRKRVLFKNAAKGFLCPKMHIERQNTRISRRSSSIKNTDFYGRFVF